MATQDQQVSDDSQEESGNLSSRDDCGITIQGAELTIPLLANDIVPGRPSLLRIEDVEGDLWFDTKGEAIYRWDEPQSAIAEFRYEAVYDQASTPPATVFLLVNGQGPLPAKAFDDPALADACSRAAALGTTRLDAPGEAIPVPAPGYRIEVVVDAFAGHKIELIDPVFSPESSKWITVEGGVLVFLEDGRVVFLLGAHQADAPLLPEYVLLDELDEPQAYTAQNLLIDVVKSKPVFDLPEGAKAEFASNYQVIYDAPRTLTLEALDKSSFPLCQQEASCQVFGYEGDAFVMIAGAEQVGLLPFAPGAAAFANVFDGLFGSDAFDRGAPGTVLAAAGPDPIVLPDGDGRQSELSVYWLARHPEDQVVVIEDFFDRAAEATPPQLALGESRFVAADVLLAAGRPADGFEGVPGTVVEIDASAFPPREPMHGGGASFSPVPLGDIGTGPGPVLEQDPTVPALGPPPPTINQLPPTDSNRAPVANDDLAATFRDAPITLVPLANDFDPDPRDSIQVVSAELLLEVSVPQPGTENVDVAGSSPLATASGAVVGIEAGGTVQYTPSPGFSGTATLRYVISDGRAESEPAIISVAVAASNQAPDANPDQANTAVDTPVDIDVLDNDEDPDGIPNSLLPRPIPLTIESIVARPDHGAASIIGTPGDQQIRYDPSAGFSGIDSFSYTAFDGLSTSAPGQVTVRVGEVTFAALPDQGSTDEVTPIVIDVLANDEFDRTAPFELELGPLTPDRGAIRLDLIDTVTFDPDGAFDALNDGDRAEVTFDYTLTQGGESSTATVSVIVEGITQPPPQNVPPVLNVDAKILPPGEQTFAFETSEPFPDAAGVDQDDLTLDLDRPVSIEFQSSEAAFANSLGWYLIEEGRPIDPQLLFADASTVADGTSMDLGLLPAGTALGFFLIQNGFSLNAGLDDPGAELEFRPGPDDTLQLFRIDGSSPELIQGDVLHTVDAFNPGDQTQAFSGLNAAEDALTIGFEDKVRADPAQNSDDDFNDAIFDLHYTPVLIDEPELLLDVMVTNDNPQLSGAIVRLTGGERLLFEDVLDEVEGIRVSEQSTGDRLILEGVASLDAYEQVLEAIGVEPPPNEVGREISFQVVDAPAEPLLLSNIATVNVLVGSMDEAAATAAMATA